MLFDKGQVVLLRLLRLCEVVARLGLLACLQEVLVNLYDSQFAHSVMVVALAFAAAVRLTIGLSSAPRTKQHLLQCLYITLVE